MKSRQRGKKKGGSKERVFGCDLLEHLQHSGQEVPQVLRSCAEFVEEHGVVDGIYRLSGVSSNIQKLRQEFEAERRPDLRKDIYLQDIHCVSSLCKAYFRELPDPLLTYRLYDKFAEAVAVQLEPQRLIKIRDVLEELPSPHYRTLEYLMRHLVHMASFSSQTNMHARNLAIVWAPNLLRSKDIEASGFNGTAAFMEVRVQSIVVEFILTHVEQLFGGATLAGGEAETSWRTLPVSRGMICPDESLTRPYHLPSVLQAGDGPPQIRPYHTIIEFGDHKRKGSLKVRKWKSIFNLGRSGHDTKRKSSRVGEDREEKSDKVSLRPAKSMDSLSAAAGVNDEPEGLGKSNSSRSNPLQLESLEDVSMAGDGEREAEVEPQSGTNSEPGTPRASRAGARAAGCNRAERCAGVHISDPFNVNVPSHITSILSVAPNIISNMAVARLTRGLECPALQARSISGPNLGSGFRDEKMETSPVTAPLVPNPECPRQGPSLLPAQEDSLSQEVQDSFSFLEDSGSSSEPEWAGGEIREAVLAEATCSPGEDDPNIGYMEELMGAGPQVEEFSVEPPLDDLSLDEALFVLAPSCCSPDIGTSEQEEDFGEDVFLSAYDDLSPLLVTEPQGGKDLGRKEDEVDGSQTFSENGGKRAFEEVRENKVKASESSFEANEKASEGSQEPEARVDRGKGIDAKRNEKEVEEVRTREQKEAEGDEEKEGEETFRGEKSVEEKTEDEEKPGGMVEVEHEENIGKEEKTKDQDKTGVEAHVENRRIGEELKADGENTEGQEKGSKKDEDQAEIGNCMVDGEVKSQSPEGTEGNLKTLDSHKIDESKETVGEESGYRNKECGEKQDREDEGSLEWDAESISGTRECGDGEADQGARVDSLSRDLEPEVAPWRSSNVTGHDANPLGMEVVPQSPSPEDREPEGQTTVENCVLCPCAPSSSGLLPEPAGSVSMRLASTLVQVQQVKSVPVVPPKPQFAKMPSTLGSKIHVAPANPCPRPGRLDGTPGEAIHGTRASRSSWRNGGSLSFDAAVALARERQRTEAQVVRRTQTCIGDGDGSLFPNISSSILPPVSSSRPLSCLEPQLPGQQGGPRSRHSLPLGESQPLNTVISPQRRTYAFEEHAGLGEGEGL